MPKKLGGKGATHEVIRTVDKYAQGSKNIFGPWVFMLWMCTTRLIEIMRPDLVPLQSLLTLYRDMYCSSESIIMCHWEWILMYLYQIFRHKSFINIHKMFKITESLKWQWGPADVSLSWAPWHLYSVSPTVVWTFFLFPPVLPWWCAQRQSEKKREGDWIFNN